MEWQAGDDDLNMLQHHLEQLIALTLIAFTIGLCLREEIHDVVYSRVALNVLQDGLLGTPSVDVQAQPKCLLYSGLFVLLKQKLRLSAVELNTLAVVKARAFASFVYGHVRSFI